MKFNIYIDEAGRGPLAGPLSCGLILPLEKTNTDNFKDSKKLPEKQREKCLEEINQLENENKIIHSYGEVSNMEIDKYGITKSINLAISRGLRILLKKYYINIIRKEITDTNNGYDILLSLQIEEIFRKKKIGYQEIKKIINLINQYQKLGSIIIDGNSTFGLDKNLGQKIITIIKGDDKVPFISMASIIAKVNRDNYMKTIGKNQIYQKYGFEKHKGYGTKTHRESIIKNGISNLHRKLFCKNLFPDHKIGKFNNRYFINNTKFIFKKNRPKLLLHICCSPDLTYPLKLLKKYFKIYLFRYNPNILDHEEYKKRYNEYIKLIGIEKGDYEILNDRYDTDEFMNALWENRKLANIKSDNQKTAYQKLFALPEKSGRCDICYNLRLFKSLEIAKKNKINYYTTTLSISPMKTKSKIKKFGIKNQNNKVKFLYFDFTKNGGYQKSLKLCKKYNIRRQNYCGCINPQN